MKKSLKEKLVEYLNTHEGWHTKGSLFVITESLGYSPETGGRKLREAAEEGSIMVEYYSGAHAKNLAKYSRLEEQKKVVPIIKEINGQRIAVWN